MPKKCMSALIKCIFFPKEPLLQRSLKANPPPGQVGMSPPACLGQWAPVRCRWQTSIPTVERVASTQVTTWRPHGGGPPLEVPGEQVAYMAAHLPPGRSSMGCSWGGGNAQKNDALFPPQWSCLFSAQDVLSLLLISLPSLRLDDAVWSLMSACKGRWVNEIFRGVHSIY